jgi:hypothetical protein
MTAQACTRSLRPTVAACGVPGDLPSNGRTNSESLIMAYLQNEMDEQASTSQGFNLTDSSAARTRATINKTAPVTSKLRQTPRSKRLHTKRSTSVKQCSGEQVNAFFARKARLRLSW